MATMMLTEYTCADACWHAREKVCRCSCAGRNHGCLRDGGDQPTRTRRIRGVLYRLSAVEVEASCRAVGMQPLYKAQRELEEQVITAGLYTWGDLMRRDNPTIAYPCYVRTASAPEMARWPELAAWRGYGRPLTLWVRADIDC